MDCLEQDAAKALREQGIESAWGCKDGVFITSSDAFRLVKLIRMLKFWARKSATQKTSFLQIRQIIFDSIGIPKKTTEKSSDDGQSGKGAYKDNGVNEIDLG